MKRLLDIIVSGCGLVVFLPLFFAMAIWIKFDSDGPVFYRQVRVGRNNKDFRIFKFRTMKVGSDKQYLITVGAHDSRVTRSGYFIRKYKLDEFSQLINVLTGDMSIVGPRPEVRKYVDMYTASQMHILDVRPGITSPASIRYRNENEILEKSKNPERYYTNVIMQDKLAVDLEYVHNSSLWYDIKLIFQTLWKMVSK